MVQSRMKDLQTKFNVESLDIEILLLGMMKYKETLSKIIDVRFPNLKVLSLNLVFNNFSLENLDQLFAPNLEELNISGNFLINSQFLREKFGLRCLINFPDILFHYKLPSENLACKVNLCVRIGTSFSPMFLIDI